MLLKNPWALLKMKICIIYRAKARHFCVWVSVASIKSVKKLMLSRATSLHALQCKSSVYADGGAALRRQR